MMSDSDDISVFKIITWILYSSDFEVEIQLRNWRENSL